MQLYNSLIKPFAVYKHPLIILILLMGFSSGLPLSLTASTLTAWLAKTGVEKSSIGLFAAVGTPYALKFLWSHLTDHLPLPFLTKTLGRRRAWMLLSQISLIVTLFGLGLSNPAENLFATAMWALAVSISSATQDIVIDAYRIEILKQEQQGAGAAATSFGYRIAMLLSGGGALILAQHTDWVTVYSIMAAFMLVGIIATFIAREPDTPHIHQADTLAMQERLVAGAISAVILLGDYILLQYKEVIASSLVIGVFSLGSFLSGAYYIISSFLLLGLLITFLTGKSLRQTVFMPFADFMGRPGWHLILVFVLLYKFGDAFAGSMTNPFLIETGFTLTEIGAIVKTFGFAATMVGAFIGGAMINRIGLIPSLWIGGIFQMLSNLMFAGQAIVGHSELMLTATIAVENLSSGMGGTAFVAYLSLLCNKHFTATQYALFSSFAAVGRTLLTSSIFYVDKMYFPSGSFIDHIGWVAFFIITTLAAIPGLVMLAVLRGYLKRKGTRV